MLSHLATSALLVALLPGVLGSAAQAQSADLSPASGPAPTRVANRRSELLFEGPSLPEPMYVDADVYYQDGVHYREWAPVHASEAALPVEPYGYEQFEPDWEATDWQWQILPDGLIYKSYLAGVKESRFAAHFFNLDGRGWLMDASLGGRVPLLRYGTTNDAAPQGWQFDLEGAAFPRIDLSREWDLSADFRAGAPLTYGVGNWQYKFAYYHLSSHLGDEEIIALGSFESRINFARDALVFGVSYHLNPSLRIYGEAAWAFFSTGGSEPWEFQFGLDYSPVGPGTHTLHGAPFFAINGHLREELNFSGNVTVQAGWQWRGRTGHLFRAGLHYYNGGSSQYEFFRQFEEQIGFGLWYDY